MRILILGGNGYLGWPTALYLNRIGHTVRIVDGLNKEKWEESVGVAPLLPTLPLHERVALSHPGIAFEIYDIAKGRDLYRTVDRFKPDTIIHYAEQPSAPYSHIDRGRAVFTQLNNIAGTLNLIFAVLHSNRKIHIIKLGTMGEYGTPNIDIEEGWLQVKHKGRTDRMLYPKQPGSFYHLSKVHDSHNLEFACRSLGLRVTDLNQGIVYGVHSNETEGVPGLHTSFHYDAIFGTVINRFLAQAAIEEPLTVYGEGEQQRGFLNIKDTLRCVELSALHPPKKGEFRVFNQFTEVFSILRLAERISEMTGAKVKHLKNPRVEASQHFYKPHLGGLFDLGFNPNRLTDITLEKMYKDVLKMLKDGGEVNKDSLKPTVKWLT